MEYNSYFFIFVFLPIFILSYFGIAKNAKINIDLNKIFLIISGLVFYCYTGKMSIIVLGISIFTNCIFAHIIKETVNLKKCFLSIAIVLNICLLAFFKYTNFTISTINGIMGKDYAFLEIALPVGISFFTFQQIMYLVSVYNRKINCVIISDYLSYILFFPKIMMGPIIEPVDLINQINDKSKRFVNWDNVASGLRLFSYGLFKKLILADTFGNSVSWTFCHIDRVSSGDLFLTMIFYTFQIYFDFSGYIDMSIGIARMINIDLPINFRSPYKAFSISDFWKRWHMSLTCFFTNYIYIPLGGNRKGKFRTYMNIMIVFLVSGMWHGANWTFILWGGVYGLILILERITKIVYDKINVIIQWAYTFTTVSLLWLLFRADSVSQWIQILKQMFSFNNMAVSDELLSTFVLPEMNFLFDVLHINGLNNAVRGFPLLLFTLSGFIICLLPGDNYEGTKNNTCASIIMSSVVLVWSILCLGSTTTFVYSGF